MSATIGKITDDQKVAIAMFTYEWTASVTGTCRLHIVLKEPKSYLCITAFRSPVSKEIQLAIQQYGTCIADISLVVGVTLYPVPVAGRRGIGIGGSSCPLVINTIDIKGIVL